MTVRAAKCLTIIYFVLIYISNRGLQGIPTLDSLSSGNTVVTESGLSVIGTTTQCYRPIPSFTWELVSTNGSFSSVLLTGNTATATVGGSCSGGSSLYTGSVSVSYSVNKVVYGQVVNVRLTINNTSSISTTSTGTLSFPVSYTLTGSSEMASLGQQFTWTCQMTLPPNQTQAFIRFYRNETSVGIVGYNTQCQGFNVNSRYNYSCTTQREFNLIIPAQSVTKDEQNTTWRCAYYSGSPSYSSIQKQLVIAIDINSMSLDPSDDPLTMTAGEQRTVRCVVNDDASPVPVYRWFIGTTVVGDRSTFTITGRKSDNGMSLRCQATNNNKPRNASITLNIQYKPEVTTSTSSPYRVVEGQSATMTCSVSAANPNTGITWSWIKTDSPSNVLHTESTYTISNIQRGRSGTYSCTARNSIGISTPVTVQLDVQYKPEVTTSTSSPYRVKEGQSATMTCSVSNANPNTGITWSWIKTDSPSNVLHRGATYTISNIQRGASGTYSCTATNSIGISTPVTVQVDVQYKPEVTNSTSSPYRVVEGQSATMTCIVIAANPNTGITWSWIKTDSPSTVLHTGPTYTISNIQRGASGTYSCTATNSIGISTPVTVQVDVQYKPEVTTSTSSPYRVVEGQSATMACSVSAANPNTGFTWSWIKTDSPSNVLHTGSTYTISNIQRGASGTYSCTARNSVGTSTPVTVKVDVQYGPELITLSPEDSIINKTENQTVRPVDCSAVCNPACTYRWTGNSGNSGRLELGELKRTERGNYTCTASNTIRSSTRTISVIVNYPPKIEDFQASGDQTYEESSSFSITCNVDSYPYSAISIQNVETGESIASDGPRESLTFHESSAKCYQTANYSCYSANSYGSTSSRTQRIQVYCSPRPSDGKSSIDMGIKTGEGLNISTQFIGYPLPTFSWNFKKNVTDNPTSVPGQHQQHSRPVNVSTIQTGLTKETLSEEEFGFYTVTATTPGKQSQTYTVTFHVIPERKPNSPYNITVVCKISRGTALVNWTPNFDGGARQAFSVFYRGSDGFQKNATKTSLPNATITGLKDGSMYFFQVIASNKNGHTFSEEEESCITKVMESSPNTLPVIAGGAAGGLAFAGLVIFGIFIVFRRINGSKGGKKEREAVLSDERESDEEDGLKDNVLYVSADDDKPGVSGAAVYAEVKKKGPSSDNNANVYAEVKKPGQKASDEGALYSDVVKPKKGLFKKEVKPKQKKGKKQKQKMETPDVYENSEDIAMTQNRDNVYSNAEEHNAARAESRGYKNQDGLLYVDVQFDKKPENGKQHIHGEDEKTDYATVEFPFPKSNKADTPRDETK